MDEVGPSTQHGPGRRARKQMRKGTHSCIECRRRKIRCTFAAGASICRPCSTRGSRCVDQHQDIGLPSREASPRVLTRSAGSFRDLVTSDVQDTSDADISVNQESNQVPLVSFIAESEHWSTGCETSNKLSPVLADGPESGLPREGQSSQCSSILQSRQRKAKDVCAALRSALPSYDSIMSTISEHGSWWVTFRFKTHLNVGKPVEDLAAFAARTYTSSNPALLATLVTAYARSLNSYNQLFAVVESLVVSEFEYVSTIEGMQCLILLAKSLTEVGHPRRSWLIWRKGMAIAQLMGLYRTDDKQVLATNIWWAVYHGDRFTSLLLGVPHGFNDSYYASKLTPSQSAQDQLVLQTVMLAGKVIEQNLASSKPSLAETLSLDEQLDKIAAFLPKEWWDTSNELYRSAQNDELRERLLLQFYFFHIRTYLHLPNMAKSATAPTSIISKLACMEASCQMLMRFVILQSTVQGSCLFECKTTAFLAFMAAVLLILGLDNLGRMETTSSSKDDKGLLVNVRDIFHDNMKKDGSKISSQCFNALGKLMKPHGNEAQLALQGEETEKIPIPYFGIVLRRRTRDINALPVSRSQTYGQLGGGQGSTTSQLSDSSLLTGTFGDMEPQSLEYLGRPISSPMLGSTEFVGEDLDLNGSGDFSWTDSLMMDLDHDWNLFTSFGNTS